MWWKGVGGDDVLYRYIVPAPPGVFLPVHCRGCLHLTSTARARMLGLLHLDDYVARLGRASRSRVRYLAPGTARSIAPKGAKPHAALNACLPSLC